MAKKSEVLNAGFASWVARKPSGLSVKGSREEISVIKEALSASRDFRDTLCTEGADMKEVMSKLSKKKIAARRFEAVMGYPWPL